MIFVVGKKFITFDIGAFTSTMALEVIFCTIANFRKRFPSVENMSM